MIDRLPLVLLLACKPAPPAPTPESVAATAAEGDPVDVSGVVHAVTLDTVARSDTGPWDRLPGRWVLVRSADADGITKDDVELDEVFDDDVIRDAWVLGIHVDDGAPLPRVGDEARLVGTFHEAEWNGHPVPAVDGTLEAPAHGVGDGATCAHDEDCADHLVCDRATAACAAPAETGWGSLWRDVDGHCTTDADCPFGQHCDLSYVVPDSGPYTWRFDAARKRGASLCVLDEDTVAASCPTIWRPADLQSGRFAEGREFCVEGTVLLELPAEDGDTHVQLGVDEPVPYPSVDGWIVPVGSVMFVGATTEIGPPHKSPDRPQGAVEDPGLSRKVISIGTYRWDDDHGWYEQHPVKRWWPVD